MKIVHQHAGGTLLEAGGPDPFGFSAAGSLSQVLSDAGFHAVEESARNVPWTWPGDTAEVFEYARSCSTPFRPLVERVPQEKWPAILAEVHAAINQYRVGDEIRFGAIVVLASGRA